MNSRFFVDRPIFATVISLFIVLAGAMAIRTLPIAEFPDIVPPEVSVDANYPGASADVIAQTVAAPLEQSINGVDNMLYMHSVSSSSGSVSISVTFAVGTDPDQNTINVNNRVQAALATLPAEVRAQGVTVRKQSSSMLQVLTLDADQSRYDTVFVSNYALVNVIDELKRLPGVGDASIFGSKDYSMRVWLKPDRLAQLGLTPSDVATALEEQNAQFAAGAIGDPPYGSDEVEMRYTVTTQGRLTTPEEFGNIILRANSDGSILRLKDVARLELGSKSYTQVIRHDGNPAVAIGIYLAPGANALATADRVTAKMDELSKRFPDGLAYSCPYDTTTFVRLSINEVLHTLVEAFVLVFLIIFLFLQDWRATIIPCLAVPVSIIGTFAGMYMLGFSINTLTLFGLVLAIGIVVDDAIIVIENVERIMRTEKVTAHEAAARSMKEVAGVVIAVVLVLCAVFVPVAFMGGLAGEMYKQFAVTIAVSVVLSGIVALTLTPALCALLLRPHHHEPVAPLRLFNRLFEKLTGRYTSGVKLLLRRGVLTALLFAVILGATWQLFAHVPGALVPDEDKGTLLALAMLPEGASQSRSGEVMNQVDNITQNLPEVQSTVTLTGFDLLSHSAKSNSGTSFVTLKDWDKRERDVNQIVGDIFRQGYSVLDGFIVAFGMPPISGMSNTGGFEGYVQNRGDDDAQAMVKVLDDFVAAANKHPELANVRTTFGASSPQLDVRLDREKAVAMGVPVNRVFETMQATFGAYYVNDFNKLGRTFKVQLQSEADYRSKPEDLDDVYVRSDTGGMVPLAALVSVHRTVGPDIMERFNVFPAAKIVGGPAAGYSSGQALAALEQTARETLPAEYALSWSGTAYQERATGGTSSQVFVLGLIMVFLILAAQYEKWTLPLAVMMVVPFALFGAILATWLRGLTNDVYFQIALVTLVGLASKNAIMIVEFAEIQRERGMSLMEAAVESARLRFRPIIMTSLAFVLGCVPLAISHGAGANSRHSIGTGVIGGMLAATFIATLFIPAFYAAIMVGTDKLRTLFKSSK